jgi:transposase
MTQQAQFPDLPPVVESSTSGGQAVVPLRLSRANRQQVEWRMAPLDDLLREGHPARSVWKFVAQQDLSDYVAEARAIEGHAGRPAIEPAVLLALWLYATSRGVGSAREVERLTKEHDAYRWLCGGVSVNYHTLSVFRNQGKKLDDLLTRSLAVLTREGLLTLERGAQDGMRVRASAGAASFRQRDTLEKHLREAEAQVQRLKNEDGAEAQARSARQKAAQERAAREREARLRRALELLPEAEATLQRQDKKPEEARTSTTDPDARVMKMADGGFRPAFNLQVVATTQTRIIIGVEAGNVGSDMAELPAMLDQLEERLGRLPGELLADGGYPSQGSLEDAYRRGVTVYAPVQKPKDPGRDRYQPLPGDSEARATWRQRMGTDEAKEIYKERGATIEWVNAVLRRYGLRFLAVRGLKKVRAVLLLAALAHNLFRVEAIRQEQATAVA